MDAKLAKVYYSPQGYWRGIAAIKKLAEAAKVPEETAKQWLIKQALWQIYLPAPRYVPRPKFDVSSPNAVYQADLLFLPHDKPPRDRKVYKYALTVVDVASCYKEAEPLTSKDCGGCESFSVDLQAQPFDVASAAAGRPWARVHGKRDQRNGKPQKSTRAP